MATQQTWMFGTPTSPIQVIVTCNPSTWQTTQIEVVNNDATHRYVFTAYHNGVAVDTWTALPNSTTTRPVTVQMQAPTPNDDGTMGNPSWPVGWSVTGVWS